MKILCTICARAGSKGLKNKALKKIKKHPLIAYTIRQAIKSKQFNEVVVSTDSKKIQSISLKYGAKSWFLRSKKLSNDKSAKIPAIKHALIESERHFGKKFDICVDLDVSSPLRNINDIKLSISQFKKENSNVLFSVNNSRKNPYFNMVEINNKKVSLIKKYRYCAIKRRQDAPKVYEMNASIYIYKRKYLINNDKLFTKKTSIYLMPKKRSIDIDDYFDFGLVKYLIKYDKKLFR